MSNSVFAFPQAMQRPWVLATTATLALGVGYAVYLDYKRSQQPVAPSSVPGFDELMAQPVPTNPKEKLEYSMHMVEQGGTFSNLGPQTSLLAAACFRQAYLSCEQPRLLAKLLKQGLPEDVYQPAMAEVATHVASRQEQYFAKLSCADVCVQVDKDPTRPSVDEGTPIHKRPGQLVAMRDVSVGEVVFSEKPLVVSLLPEHMKNESHCTYCLSKIPTDSPTKCKSPASACLVSTYCSDACASAAWTAYESPLYSKTFGAGVVYLTMELLKSHREHVHLSMLRFFGAVAGATARPVDDTAGPAGDMWEHVDHLACTVPASKPEQNPDHSVVVRYALKEAVPEMEPQYLLPDERYLLLRAKWTFNQYAIASDALPDPTNETADKDTVDKRGPMRLAGQSSAKLVLGTGLYPKASHVQHSCDPNTRVEFEHKVGNEPVLRLVACKPICKGDVLTVSYVDVDLDKKSRAQELKKWKVVCQCPKCARE